MDGSRRALPLKSSQDSGYSAYSIITPPDREGEYRSRVQNPRDSNRSQSSRGSDASQTSLQPMANVQNVPTNGKVAFEGYRKDIMNNFESEKPRYNPMNTSRPQSSALLNVNDPIQVHLLVETALGDSKEFEILSPDEVDELKRLCQSLTQRITQTRRNLAIQSKYRDAATSMAKLYSPADAKNGDKKRRSLIGNRNNNSEKVKEVDIERMASEKKCEELALELWNLEKRLMEPQKRLLQHSAGILQMTHKGPMKSPKTNGMPQGMPGSPESIHTYHNGRRSVEENVNEDVFDDRSLYRTFDRLDGFGFGGRESYDVRSSKAPRMSSQQAAEQMQTMLKTERRLGELNARLREIIVKTNPQRDSSYERPPRAAPNTLTTEPGALLAQLQYLDQSITAVDGEQQRVARRQRDLDNALEEEIEALNCELQELLLPLDASRPAPPEITGENLKSQLAYLQSSIGDVVGQLHNVSRQKSELDHATTLNAKDAATLQSKTEEVEIMLKGLWDNIQSGEHSIRQRNLDRHQARAKGGIVNDESDLSGDETRLGTPESFSMPGFSNKVQSLFSQASNLKDQKRVLQRQIKQQRDLNTKSDATKDSKLLELRTDLERTQSDLQKAEREAQDLQTQLQNVMKRLDEARRASMQRGLEKAKRDDAESAILKVVQTKLQQSNEEIERLEEELYELKGSHKRSTGESESRIATLTAELAAAETTKRGVEEKEAQMDSMNMEIARLQTEVTIARAELDGAYGSRAQRAAEVAANPAIQKEIDDLTQRNKQLATELETLRSKQLSDGNVEELRRELSETIDEYEEMTRASIGWEREREALEGEIDRLREDREALDTSLSDERIRSLGIRNSAAEGAGGVANTSTLVLKNEFKKMMRDMKADSLKTLRAEQAERKRVEEELRGLKKAQGLGKPAQNRIRVRGGSES